MQFFFELGVLTGWPGGWMLVDSRHSREAGDDDNVLDTTRVESSLVDRLRNHSGGEGSQLHFG